MKYLLVIIELDESYFGGVRKSKRSGKIFTIVVDDTLSNTLLPTITKKIAPDSVVCLYRQL